MITMTTSDFQTIVTTIAIIAGLVIYWRKGGNQASSEANASLLQLVAANKEQINQLQTRVETCEGLHRTNLGEIGRLKGIIEEKDKRISVLESVDIGKNPALMKFIENSAQREEKILTALQKVADFMGQINQHFETQHRSGGSGAA